MSIKYFMQYTTFTLYKWSSSVVALWCTFPENSQSWFFCWISLAAPFNQTPSKSPWFTTWSIIVTHISSEARVHGLHLFPLLLVPATLLFPPTCPLSSISIYMCIYCICIEFKKRGAIPFNLLATVMRPNTGQGFQLFWLWFFLFWSVF